MNTTKKSLFTSLVACFVLLSMLMGTTFAWFTDIVSSENNVIQSGSLKAEMYWSDKLLAADSDEWIDASAGAVFNYDNWEPGYTQVRYVKVVNNGSLKFKWQLSIAANGKVTELSDAIDVYYVNPVSAEITSLDGLTSVGTLTDVLDGNTAEAGNLDPKDYQILAIAFHMDEYAGNEYQDMSLCEAGFSLKLIATQATGEFDSFDNQYDADAEWPYVAIQYSESEDISDKIDTTTGSLTEDVTIGETTDDQYAEIPSDVKLADGADKLTLKIESIETPNESVPVATGESAKSVDVHIDGLAEDNTVPVTVTLKRLFKPGLNTTSVKLYHVENGTPVAMTLVSNPTNHNEFSYDPATGDVVMTVATFSEYVPVTDNKNLWEGNFDISWYNTTDKEFTLSTADQLAGFGAIVDGGGEYTNKDGTKVNVPSDMFEGKTVYLGADIDLAGGYSLNPIGCGYVNGTSNSGGGEGRSFMGTFDGGKYDGNGNLVGVHTIRYLYQNGWDLGLSYNNLGGGLFGSVCNATIKNLNMVDAEIIMECVEQGVVAGLAQGNCTFENIAISNCSVANYQKATGGVVGEVSWGTDESETAVFTHTFRNIRIDNKTVVGSLWGDFDAPVGGVIGARWDDSNRTNVVMENVEVACRLDVYNDVTSTYQWYAYRRAGMLIGNTEQVAADGRTAAATFLTCSNVKVYYGDWVDYHYCEFSEEYNSPSWPFVRVEAGENCNAYSNPRWGVATDASGKAFTDAHTKNDHTGDDECRVHLPFGQLYGGGQGVYGGGQTEDYKSTHTGVEIVNYVYTITYINDYQVLDVKYVTKEDASKDYPTENATAQGLVEKWADSKLGVGKYVFGGWMDAGSTKHTIISAGNDKDITLYPYFDNPYTARFVDQKGNVLAWCMFHSGDVTQLDDTASAAEGHLPSPGKDFKFSHWEVHVGTATPVEYNKNNFTNYKQDVTIYPVYKYTGNLKLTPVDEDNDGTIDYYMVEAVDTLDTVTTIPGNVNGVPVKVVDKLYKNDNNWDFGSGVTTIIVEEGVEIIGHNSMGYTSDLTLVKLPSTLTTLEKNSFSRNTGSDKKVITIEFAGTMADWQNIVNNSDSEWHNGLKSGSKVVCSDGYYELSNKTVPIIGVLYDYEWTPHPNT